MKEAAVKIAVIINCFNYEDYVGKAIESAIEQDASDFEVIVIDDGSTDNSWKIIKSYPVKSFRKENGGQVSACWYGQSLTSASFILFLDADDELIPGSIRKLLAVLDDNVAKIQFPLRRINEIGEDLGSQFPNLNSSREREKYIREIELAGTYISAPTSGNVFRKDLCDLLKEASYDPYVDGVILIAAPFYGDVINIDEPLGRYRIHSRNKSGTNQTPTAQIFRVQQSNFLNRVDHLKKIILRRDGVCGIKNPDQMYIYNRCENFCDILEGRRIKTKNIIRTLRSIPPWYGLIRKVLVASFLISGLVLPRGMRQAMLEARLNSHLSLLRRSLGVFKIPRSK